MKTYYRLSELSGKFGLSDEDIQYLATETDTSFCLYSKKTDVILGGWQNGDFLAAGKSQYSGLISLSKQNKTELFETQKVSVTHGLLLQKDKVENYQTLNPFQVDLPNDVLKAWLSVPFEKIHFNKVPFLFYPEERKSVTKQLSGLLEQISTIQSVESGSKQFPLKSFQPEIEKELFHHWQQFTLSDVCILKEELEKAQEYLSISADVLTNKSNRPIDLLILNLLELFPSEKPAQLWNRLQADISNEPRHYDTEEILDEVGEDTLYWFNSQSEAKQMKKKSFYNLINKLKTN